MWSVIANNFNMTNELVNEGYKDALRRRAYCFANGIGVAKSAPKAFQDLMKSFEHKPTPFGALQIMWLLSQGQGVIKDEDEARVYLFMAASLSDYNEDKDYLDKINAPEELQRNWLGMNYT